MTLGLTLKSITSSRKVVNLLNRAGHCCSYNVIEGIETEATISACEASQISPEDAILAPNYCTGVAWDNFDRFVETSSGKDTLHDTVGIFYQNLIDTDSSAVDDDLSNIFEDSDPLPAKRRRTMDPIAPPLQDYTRKLCFREKLLPINSDLRKVSCSNHGLYKKLDLAWLMSHFCEITNTPMWVGFNHKVTENNTPKQKISYLTPINESPTKFSVVYETLRQSQQIARECKQNYMQVTYDLAIAKIAFQMKSVERPRFNDLFIHMGTFHAIMALFKAIGKVINEWGLTNIMVKSKLLAIGSVKGFVSGKHYNRCKRLHPLVSLALQMLHMEAFIKVKKIYISENLVDYLSKIQSQKASSSTFNDEEFLVMNHKYLEFKEETLNGVYGKTAQFTMMYVNFVDYYQMFTRSIRVGDFDLYKLMIPKLCNLFFMLNQQNYSRWLLKYHDDLLQVEETHPELAEEFKQGLFGILRTNFSFSRLPIDLTLEQTYNADAARRLTGVTQFTNSISARQRWARSHGIRSTVISFVFDFFRLRRIQDVTAALQNSIITKDLTCLNAFIKECKDHINPFDFEQISFDYLFNIETGRSAPDDVANFLLNIEKTGQEQRDDFILQCSNNELRFESPISKNKILNFTSCTKKVKAKINNKVQEVRMQRNFFGRMLGVAMEQTVDIEKLFSYPMTPIPLSLCHLDGSICSTAKSAMQGILRNDSTLPAHVDVVLVDGFFILHSLQNVPQSFGNISKKILQTITNNNASSVHIIFDRYFSPSVKDYERDSRAECNRDGEYHISGPEQVRPEEFSKLLRKDKFKVALVKFLIDHWKSNELAVFFNNKTILLNFEKCYSYQVDTATGNVVQQINLDFECPAHEEADTKIIYHASKINENCNVVVKCSDTDILIIMLGNVDRIKAKIYIECGVSNSRHVVNISALVEDLGLDLCRALPGFHAFTGCDYNSAFYRKGKIRPFGILKKRDEFKTAFANLGDTSVDTNIIYPQLETFVCQMYGFKRNNKVNSVRYAMFLRNYKVKNPAEAFLKKKLNNFDASCLPPCNAELLQHIQRARYITHVWQNATLPDPIKFKPEESGWILNTTHEDNSKDKYEFLWFEGPQLPQLVEDIILDDEHSEGNLNQ